MRQVFVRRWIWKIGERVGMGGSGGWGAACGDAGALLRGVCGAADAGGALGGAVVDYIKDG